MNLPTIFISRRSRVIDSKLFLTVLNQQYCVNVFLYPHGSNMQHFITFLVRLYDSATITPRFEIRLTLLYRSVLFRLSYSGHGTVMVKLI